MPGPRPSASVSLEPYLNQTYVRNTYIHTPIHGPVSQLLQTGNTKLASIELFAVTSKSCVIYFPARYQRKRIKNIIISQEIQ